MGARSCVLPCCSANDDGQAGLFEQTPRHKRDAKGMLHRLSELKQPAINPAGLPKQDLRRGCPRAEPPTYKPEPVGSARRTATGLNRQVPDSAYIFPPNFGTSFDVLRCLPVCEVPAARPVQRTAYMHPERMGRGSEPGWRYGPLALRSSGAGGSSPILGAVRNGIRWKLTQFGHGVKSRLRYPQAGRVVT